MKTTTHTLRKLKGQKPIVCVTAYDAITARFAKQINRQSGAREFFPVWCVCGNLALQAL